MMLVLTAQDVHSQQKYEKESRINQKNVPQDALSFIHAVELDGKVKWYLETGLKNKSIEAKFAFNQKKYSVEFDTTGVIQDVEIELRWEEIPTRVNDSICAQLRKLCSSYQISKVQIQYSGNKSDLLSFIKDQSPAERLTTNYELIVSCVNDKIRRRFEFLFNHSGQLIQSSEIIAKSSSNLEY